PAAVRPQLANRSIDAAPRRRDARQLPDYRPAFVVFEFDLELASAALEFDFGIPADEPLRLQHFKHAHALTRVRRLHLRLAAKLAIPDTSKKIANGIRD